MEKRGKIAWLLVSIVMELVYCKIACMFTWDSFKKYRVKFQVGTPACKFMFFINPFVPNAPFLYSLKKVLWKLPQGKFPPGKLPPIKLPPGKFPPGKFPSRKFPPEIPPPISLIVFFTLSSLNTSSINGKGGWGEYILPSSLDQKFWYV